MLKTDEEIRRSLRKTANRSHVFFWPSIRALQNDTGLARQTIPKAIRRLALRPARPETCTKLSAAPSVRF